MSVILILILLQRCITKVTVLDLTGQSFISEACPGLDCVLDLSWISPLLQSACPGLDSALTVTHSGGNSKGKSPTLTMNIIIWV